MGVIQSSINQGLAMASVLGQMQGVPEMRKLGKQEAELKSAAKESMENYKAIQESNLSLEDMKKAYEKSLNELGVYTEQNKNIASKRYELTGKKEHLKGIIEANKTYEAYNEAKSIYANLQASLQKQQANEQKMQVKKHKLDKDIIGGMYE